MPTPETQLKKICKDYLRLKGIWRFHNLAGLGVYPGIPDDLAVHNGKVYALEYKTKKGVLSPYQETFKKNWEERGLGNCIWITVRDLDDLMVYF